MDAAEREALKEELRREIKMEQVAKMHIGLQEAVKRRRENGYEPVKFKVQREAIKTSRKMTVEEQKIVRYEQRKLGYFLREMRKKKGLGLIDMAMRVGISQPMISKMELGSGNFTLSMFIRYANELGMFPTLAFKNPK